MFDYVANLGRSTIDGHKDNSLIVSDASLGTAPPRSINLLFIWLICFLTVHAHRMCI
jgi:hypothetical protein